MPNSDRTTWGRTMIRLLLVSLSAVLAVPSARAKSDEDEALAKLQKFKPDVLRDKNAPGQPVLKLRLVGPEVTDAELALVKVFTSLRELDLNGEVIKGPGLAHLESLEHLESLGLPFTPIAKEGLPHLTRLKQLKRLDLGKTKLKDEGLDLLRRMEQLEELSLIDNPVGDAGMKHLTALKKLKALNVAGSRVSSEGVQTIAELPDLKRLVLSGTPIDDEALAHLSKLKGIETLHLVLTPITDGGLRHLEELPTLRLLYLSNCRSITAPTVVKHVGKLQHLEELYLYGVKGAKGAESGLKKVLPKCKVHH